MKNIGFIDKARMSNIPEKCQAAHEFCFHLHDLMAHLLVEMETQGAPRISVKIETEDNKALLESGVHYLDFLEKSGRGDMERLAVVNQMGIALYADMLHFVYEGMIALEKRKFSVAFALLRKLFKEGMLLAAQMCADEDAFFKKMKFDAKNLLNRKVLDETGVKHLLTKAIASCRGKSFANPELIYGAVFDRKNANGLGTMFDKATHLITEFSQIQTENYNINFIFKNPLDNDVYESVYPQLAMLLFFLNIMQIELYGRMRETDKKYQNWMLFTAIGAYESLFSPGKSRMTRFLNSNFGELLVCPHCSANIRVKKIDAPRLFIGEIVDCKSCGKSHHFPLGWLLSKVELALLDD